MYKKRKLWGYAFVAPQLIGLILFSLIPLVQAFLLSFQNWDGMGAKTWIGLENYIDAFGTADFAKSLLNTLKYTLYFVPADVILALLIAMGVKNVAGKTFYRLFYFMPVVSGSVAVGVIWTWLLNEKTGLINMLLKMAGLPGVPWLVDKTLVLMSIAMVSVWWNVGYNMVIFLAGLQGIPQTYYEAASIDGANKFQQFRHITVPMVSSTTFFVLITTIISSFQVFDQAFVMTQGGPAKASYTFVYYIYESAFIKFKMGYASACAMVLFVIILLITMFQMWVSNKWVNYDV